MTGPMMLLASACEMAEVEVGLGCAKPSLFSRQHHTFSGFALLVVNSALLRYGTVFTSTTQLRSGSLARRRAKQCQLH